MCCAAVSCSAWGGVSGVHTMSRGAALPVVLAVLLVLTVLLVGKFDGHERDRVTESISDKHPFLLVQGTRPPRAVPTPSDSSVGAPVAPNRTAPGLLAREVDRRQPRVITALQSVAQYLPEVLSFAGNASELDGLGQRAGLEVATRHRLRRWLEHITRGSENAAAFPAAVAAVAAAPPPRRPRAHAARIEAEELVAAVDRVVAERIASKERLAADRAAAIAWRQQRAARVKARRLKREQQAQQEAAVAAAAKPRPAPATVATATGPTPPGAGTPVVIRSSKCKAIHRCAFRCHPREPPLPNTTTCFPLSALLFPRLAPSRQMPRSFGCNACARQQRA